MSNTPPPRVTGPVHHLQPSSRDYILLAAVLALAVLGYAVVSCTHRPPQPSPQPTAAPTLPVFVSPTQPAYKPTVPAPVTATPTKVPALPTLPAAGAGGMCFAKAGVDNA